MTKLYYKNLLNFLQISLKYIIITKILYGEIIWQNIHTKQK